MSQSYELTIRDALECCSSPLGLLEPEAPLPALGHPYSSQAGLEPCAPPAYRPAPRFAYSPPDAPPPYSPLQRLQDLTSMMRLPDLGLPAEDLPARRGAVRSLGAESGYPGAHLAERDLGKSSCFAPLIPEGSPEFSSPASNGYLHFESTLFENGERKQDGGEGGTVRREHGEKTGGSRSGFGRSGSGADRAADEREHGVPNLTVNEAAELSVPNERSQSSEEAAGVYEGSDEGSGDDCETPSVGKSPSRCWKGENPNPNLSPHGPPTNTVSLRELPWFLFLFLIPANLHPISVRAKPYQGLCIF